MPRVKGGYVTRRRRKGILKLAKGYFGSKHTIYKTAHEQVMHSWKYAFRDRRNLKREMRKLWIARINAAARMNDISYSRLMNGLKLSNVLVNRKMLSEMAIHDPKGFSALVEKAKKAIEKAA
ncbi:MAG: 50S ribosomal protein L20 [Erysipelotrichaceae bacterium]|jgi:large subunit ribosomal protein L20|nr:50S ribosomal protein L20 [Erysipelotrichaceae bacterium]